MPIKNIFRLKKKERGEQHSPLSATPSNSNPPPHSDASKSTVNTSSSPSTSLTSTSNSNYSNSNSNSNIYSQYNSLNNNDAVPKELIPIVTLINCQNSRVYHKGQVYMNIERNEANSTAEQLQDLSYVLVDGIVKGNQLILHKEGLEASSFKPISINLLEASVVIDDDDEPSSLVLSSSNKLAYHLKFPELKFLQQWLSAIKLSNYEFTKLNESYTASLLSSKAMLLSDLHVLMAETRFQNEEWVNIKFSKNSNWIKCFCVITPCDHNKINKKSSSKTKNGTVNFYTSTRTTKKNLICSINSIDSCFAVYPNHVDLIDDSTLLKLNGDLTVYNLGMKLDDDSAPSSPISRTNSMKSLSPVPQAPTNNNNNNQMSNARSRSNSNRHLRSTSISSITSSKSMKGWSIANTSLYILPRPHNAVKNFETLIRFLIPLYDSFQLYGRPKRLIAEKFEPQSLLFGLPSLPHTEYLTTELAYNLINTDWSNIVKSNESFDYISLFSQKLKQLYLDNPNSFKGFGNLKNSLYNEVNFEDPLTKFNSYSIPDFDDTMTDVDPSTPKYAFSISDLPANAQADEHMRISSASNLNMLASSTASPRLRSSSNQFGGPIATGGVGSYTNLNSLVSPISTNMASDSRSPNLNSPYPNGSPALDSPSTASPTAITAHQAVFKKNRDSVPVVA